MPERIQRQRKKDWRMPSGAIYIGRPGPYGNPYPIGSRHIFRDVDSGQEFEGTVVDVKGSMAFFRKYAVERLRGNPDWLKPLRGKTLACWCPVNMPCHGDILLELANAPEP